MKLALFDFCDTLVSFQTADAYVDYVRNKYDKLIMRFLNLFLKGLVRLRIIAVFNKFFPGSALSKKIKLLQLKGFTNEQLDKLAFSFYRDRIKPSLILPVIEEMKRLAGQGYAICIVSAGYSIYLKYFAEDQNIKHVIATEIAFNHTGKICLGTIAGKDCYDQEKVNRINAYFAGQNINFNDCISFSDSISDLPILLLTGQGVVVSKNKSQEWSKQYKFKEIIWT